MAVKKFGRKPRAYDPRVPQWGALTSGKRLAALPPSVNYTGLLPASLGEYFNDTLGDCTCAAVYHAIQVWTANANPPIDSEPANDALLLYEQSCGYVLGDPSTDQGGVEQDVLGYWVQSGAPVGPTGTQRQNLVAFVEIDQRILPDVKQAILQGGLVYIGFNVPTFFDPNAQVWDVNPNGNSAIIAGHAVVIAGYDDNVNQFTLISWGQLYKMTYAFFAKFVDEVYFLADQDWIETTGKSPGGLTLVELAAAMQALKWSGPTSHDHRWHIKRRRRHARLGI
jgi:hypothetical protein